MASEETKLDGYSYTVKVGPLEELSFLNQKVVYRTIEEPDNSRVIVLGFLVTKEKNKVIVAEIEERKKPRYSMQITPEQKGQLETLLKQQAGISKILFWPEKAFAL